MQDYLTPIELPFNLWNKTRITAGPVGSTGEANLQVRLKQSAPDLNPRYAPWCSGEAEKYLGSNVQDGRARSFSSGGYNARVYSRPMGYRQGFKSQQGWIHEDLRALPRKMEPIQQDMPQFSWKSQVASVQRAKTTGQQFLPLPGGYELYGQPRGSQIPRIVEQSSGTGTVLPATEPIQMFQRYVGGRDVNPQEIQPTSFHQIRFLPNKRQNRNL